MSNDTTRDAFEAHFKHLDLSGTDHDWRGFYYAHSHVDAIWHGWQAATPQWLPIADAPFNIDLLVLRMTGNISQDYRSAQYPNTWTHWQPLPLPPTATPQGNHD